MWWLYNYQLSQICFIAIRFYSEAQLLWQTPWVEVKQNYIYIYPWLPTQNDQHQQISCVSLGCFNRDFFRFAKVMTRFTIVLEFLYQVSSMVYTKSWALKVKKKKRSNKELIKSYDFFSLMLIKMGVHIPLLQDS